MRQCKYGPATVDSFTVSDTQITCGCRLAVVLLGGWLFVLNPCAADAYIARLWQLCRGSAIFWLEAFEPLFASVCFFTWINAWRVVDACSGLTRWQVGDEAGRAPQRAAYRFWNGVQLGWSSTSFGVAALLAYLAPLLAFHAVWPRHRARLLLERAAAPSASTLFAEVLGSMAIYDALHWPLHLAQHSRLSFVPTDAGGLCRLLLAAMRRLHRQLAISHATHHSGARPLQAGEVVRHSMLDGSLQVLCNVAALHLVGSHPLARLLHNAAVTYLLTEAHCSFDCPWMAHRVLPRGWLGGSTRHEAHHRDPVGTTLHQQLFTYLDNAREIWHTWWRKPSSTPSLQLPEEKKDDVRACCHERCVAAGAFNP